MKTVRNLLVLTVLLVGCATPYQARKWAGGYSETTEGPDVYEVMFASNAYTDDATTRAYLKYRCAELTKEKGFDHFVVLEGKDLTTLSLAPNLDIHEKPAHTAKIKLGRGAPPGGGNVFVAAEVLRELEPQIKR